MNDALVDRAEALMGRRRSFVATPPSPPEAVTPAVAADPPVLTEVVDLTPAPAPPPAATPVELLLQELGGDLANSIAERLASELPSLLDAALVNLASDLKSGIAAATETALADFIARRKQLPLPFPEAPADAPDATVDSL